MPDLMKDKMVKDHSGIKNSKSISITDCFVLVMMQSLFCGFKKNILSYSLQTKDSKYFGRRMVRMELPDMRKRGWM